MFPLQTSKSLFGFTLIAILSATVACSDDHREELATAKAGAESKVSSEPTVQNGPLEKQQSIIQEGGSISIDWEDPEPPEAQALAESVVNEPFNQNKTSSLEMHITTLVDRTTGIEGFATEINPVETSLEDRLEALGAKMTDTEIKILLPGSILFDFNSAAIRADAERSLKELVFVLNAYGDRPARIEGHTDSIASQAYNLGLSKERADSVRIWCVEHGIESGRIKALGWGEGHPVADNATAEGRQENRRVEVIIEKSVQ